MGAAGEDQNIRTFNETQLNRYCDLLARESHAVNTLIRTYGLPLFPKRNADFEGLVRLILEQQVSLASAISVLGRLKQSICRIRPETVLSLDDEAFKAFGFSKQKIRYVRALALEITRHQLNLEALSKFSDEAVRSSLTAITGIGQWTCDCFLLLHLKRLDIFPAGDLALVKSMKENRFVPGNADRSRVSETAHRFSPYRSILSLILWHAYKRKRGIEI